MPMQLGCISSFSQLCGVVLFPEMAVVIFGRVFCLVVRGMFSDESAPGFVLAALLLKHIGLLCEVVCKCLVILSRLCFCNHVSDLSLAHRVFRYFGRVLSRRTCN